MLPEPPATNPRRKWHLLRWAFVVFAIVVGWGGWRHYDFRKAVEVAKERGWSFTHWDPVAKIRANWRAAFRKETWTITRSRLYVSATDPLYGRPDVIRRLNPAFLSIETSSLLRDLSVINGLSHLTTLQLFDCRNLTNIDALKNMKGLTWLLINDGAKLANIDVLKELKNLTLLDLTGCSALTHVDALRNLKALRRLDLTNCHGLKNVDVLHGLTGLEELNLVGCTGLTKEAVDALKTALPKAEVFSDYEK